MHNPGMLRGGLLILYNLTVMVLLAVTGLILHLFIPHRHPILHLGRIWARGALWLCGARVRVEHGQRLRGPSLAVCNHASAVDIYLMCGYFPIPYAVVVKEELVGIPFFGWAIRAGGAVPLERTGGRRDIERLHEVGAALAEGRVVLFFAEGTRSKDGRLGRFKKGAFVTAIRHGVPLIPVVITGSHHIQRAGRLRVRAGEVGFKVLEAIPVAGLDYRQREELLEVVRSRIARELPLDQKPAGGCGEEQGAPLDRSAPLNSQKE